MNLKLRNGIYQLDTYVDGKRVRVSLGTGDKAEALKRVSERATPATVTNTAMAVGNTLRVTFERALREHGRWRDAKSQRTLWSTFAALAGHFGENRSMTTIDRAAVLAYVDQMRRDGLAGSTINARLSMLNVLCKVEELDRPRVDRAKVRPGRIRTLSLTEEARVLAWFRKAGMDDMVCLTEFLIDTGCRLGEALRADAHQLDGNVLPVWENKADHPRRIPLSPRAMHALGHFDHLTVDTADDKWAKMRAGIGLEHDDQFVIHALRHTRASRMAAEGHSAAVIQRWMGHKSLATTMKYIHLDVRDLLAAVPAQMCAQVEQARETIRVLAPMEPVSATVAVGTVNPQVPGSSPGRGAKTISDLAETSDTQLDDV